MSIWSAFWHRDNNQSKSLTIERSGTVDLLPPARPLATDTADLQNRYTSNELVFACLNIKSQSARDPRLVVEQRVRQGSDEYKPLHTHPLRRLLSRPSATMTEGDFLAAAIVSWDTSNPRRFFAEKEFRNGLLVGLHPLNPAEMFPRYDGQRRLIGYTWQSGTRRVEFSLDELLIRAAPSWYNPSPLAVVLGSVASDQGQTEYIRSFFANGGMPSVFLKDTQRPLNQQQRDELRSKWRSTYRYQHQQHDIGVLDMYQDIQKIGSTLNELDSDTLRQVAESRICMAFGVPPLIVYAYVGLMRSTYSNLKEAWAGFWDATMSPLLREWRDFWTYSLLPEFEDQIDIDSGRIRLRYDLSQVAAMQDDVDTIQKRAIEKFKAGLIRRNEARSQLGEPPDPTDYGDMYYVVPKKQGAINDD